MMFCIRLKSQDWPNMHHVAYVVGHENDGIQLATYPVTAEDERAIWVALTNHLAT